MRKIILIFSIPLMAFQCESDDVVIQNQCTTCFNEIVWFNNGVDTVLIQRTTAPMYKCERWGLNDNYAAIPNSEFWSRYKCQ